MTQVYEWPLESDLKRYPHFDKYLPLAEVKAIVSDPARVSSNSFFPFLLYYKQWMPFREAGKIHKRKVREIRYASRRDAYIFARYRQLLSEHYERALIDSEIASCPIAYRKIRLADGSGRGKCNIHFAAEAFDQVLRLGDCCAIALDISQFFESLDHALIRQIWNRLLGTKDLPRDHRAVFRAITRYAVVDRDQVYERLGFMGATKKGTRVVRGYLVPYNKMPMQLCSPKEFREKIAGGSTAYPSLIKLNKNEYGIPQGAPISDLIANFYLIDFDRLMANYVGAIGGVYYRYSDDILVIVPGDHIAGQRARAYCVSTIADFGAKLRIKDEKTSVVQFARAPDGTLKYQHIDGPQGKNGLEYLGFRFDGVSIYLRDSTVSAFYRKITLSARREAAKMVARYPGRDLSYLISKFDFSAFVQRFGRVDGFEENSDFRTWTFWTYARRAARVFGPRGKKLFAQLRNHKRIIRGRVERELDRAQRRSA